MSDNGHIQDLVLVKYQKALLEKKNGVCGEKERCMWRERTEKSPIILVEHLYKTAAATPNLSIDLLGGKFFY
jgi:hypothetical protein